MIGNMVELVEGYFNGDHNMIFARQSCHIFMSLREKHLQDFHPLGSFTSSFIVLSLLITTEESV